MKAFPRFLAITGALLIVAAMVIHIVCFATPNLATMDFQTYAENINKTLKEMISNGQEEASVSLQEFGEINPALFSNGASMDFGIWKVCIKGSLGSSTPMEACFPWGSSFPGQGSFGKPGWVDTVKGFYIAGLVLAVLAVILSNTNAHTPSQGDRQRILPIFICVTSILAGVIILIGNLTAAFSHNKNLPFPGLEKLDATVRTVFNKILERSISLSWGFALDLTSAIVLVLAGFFHFLAGRAALREDKIRRQEEMDTPLPNYDVAPL